MRGGLERASRPCACERVVSARAAPRRTRAEPRTIRGRRSLRRLAQGEEGGGPDAGEGEGGSSFADQLWSAARQGVQEADAPLSVSASAFMNPLDNTFDMNGFFASAKSLYLKQEFGQSLEMYEEVLAGAGRYGLNGYTIDQVSPMSEDEPDVMRKDYISARAVCLFNVGCIYTTFGELETAQQFLREAQGLGLNVNYFLSRAKDPTLTSLENPYLPVIGAVQVVANLKRFIDKVKNTKFEEKEVDYVNPAQPYLKDLEVKEEMDASVGAILKRVAVLSAVLTVFGGIAIIAGRIAWYS